MLLTSYVNVLLDISTALQCVGGCIWEEFTNLNTYRGIRNNWPCWLLVSASYLRMKFSCPIELLHMTIFLLCFPFCQASCCNVWRTGRAGTKHQQAKIWEPDTLRKSGRPPQARCCASFYSFDDWSKLFYLRIHTSEAGPKSNITYLQKLLPRSLPMNLPTVLCIWLEVDSFVHMEGTSAISAISS